jgi:hypothetical protein
MGTALPNSTPESSNHFVSELFSVELTDFGKLCMSDIGISEGEAHWVSKVNTRGDQELLSAKGLRDSIVKLYLYLIKSGDAFLRTRSSSLRLELIRVAKQRFDSRVEARDTWMHTIEDSERLSERLLANDLFRSATTTIVSQISGRPQFTISNSFFGRMDLFDPALITNFEESLRTYLQLYPSQFSPNDYIKYYSLNPEEWKRELTLLRCTTDADVDAVYKIISYNQNNKDLSNIYYSGSNAVGVFSPIDSLILYANHARLCRFHGVSPNPIQQKVRDALITLAGKDAWKKYETTFNPRQPETEIRNVLKNLFARSYKDLSNQDKFKSDLEPHLLGNTSSTNPIDASLQLVRTPSFSAPILPETKLVDSQPTDARILSITSADRELESTIAESHIILAATDEYTKSQIPINDFVEEIAESEDTPFAKKCARELDLSEGQKKWLQ